MLLGICSFQPGCLFCLHMVHEERYFSIVLYMIKYGKYMFSCIKNCQTVFYSHQYVGEFQLLHIPVNTWYCQSFQILAIPVNVWWYPIMVFFCTSFRFVFDACWSILHGTVSKEPNRLQFCEVFFVGVFFFPRLCYHLLCSQNIIWFSTISTIILY